MFWTNRAVDTSVGLASKSCWSAIGTVGQFVLLVTAGNAVCRKSVAWATTGTLRGISIWFNRRSCGWHKTTYFLAPHNILHRSSVGFSDWLNYSYRRKPRVPPDWWWLDCTARLCWTPPGPHAVSSNTLQHTTDRVRCCPTILTCVHRLNPHEKPHWCAEIFYQGKMTDVG